MTLKLLRLNAGLKQSDVSELYGISQQMQSEYETGKRLPGVETIIILSIAYGVTVEALIESLGYDLSGIRQEYEPRTADVLASGAIKKQQADDN